jgi:hypothetical protein
LKLLDCFGVYIVEGEKTLLVGRRLESVNISDVGVGVERVLVSFVDAEDHLKVACRDIVTGSEGVETGEENEWAKQQ